jgi:hypothetical protein
MYKEKIGNMDAWNALILAEAKAMTTALLNQLLGGFEGGLSTSLAVISPMDYPCHPERLRDARESLKVKFLQEGLGMIQEVYPGPQPGEWLFLPCLLVHGRSKDDLGQLMINHNISTALVAEAGGMTLFHQNRQQDLLTDHIDTETAWQAWKEWNQRRRIDADIPLHALTFDVQTVAEHRSVSMDTRRRLDESYGHEAVKLAMHKIMNGAIASVVVCNLGLHQAPTRTL